MSEQEHSEMVITTDGKSPHYRVDFSVPKPSSDQDREDTVTTLKQMFKQAGCTASDATFEAGDIQIQASSCPIPHAPPSQAKGWSAAIGLLNMVDQAEGCSAKFNLFSGIASLDCSPEGVSQLSAKLSAQKNPLHQFLGAQLTPIADSMTTAQSIGGGANFSATVQANLSSSTRILLWGPAPAPSPDP